MKLAIPAEAKTPDAPVCPSFGRAPHFALFDTESGNYEFMDNGAAQSSGGAGILAAQTLADHKVGALIACRCGENAAQVLKTAHIELYRAQSGSVSDNAAAFAAGKLSPLSEIHPGFHRHGHEGGNL